MNPEHELQVNLREIIYAIETTVDLVGINDTNHGKRVGYIASQIAHHLGRPAKDVDFAFELGLIHDCGVSTEQMHVALVNHFDWKDSEIHCRIGYELLHAFEPLRDFAAPILYHHTPWDELKTLDLSSDVKFFANLIFLADRIDVTAVAHYSKDILLARHAILQLIQHHYGHFFNPELVAQFVEIEKIEAFWISLDERHISRYAWDWGQIPSNVSINLEQMKSFGLILAYIVDQKSPFTAQHSYGVSQLSRLLGELLGLSDDHCLKLEVAGLLHDIGKMRIPDAILEKTGALTDIERSIMNQHSYETFEILRRIEGLGDIAVWAAFHHEGLNGIGYPFHPTELEISEECRIIAVADIFQALIQDRPYRRGMTPESALDVLETDVARGKLDTNYVQLVRQNLMTCYRVAQSEENLHMMNLADSFSKAVPKFR